jgi:hypothetical protein
VRCYLLLGLLAPLLFAGTGASAQTYAEGQVWKYKTRPNETGSLLKIDMIETDPRFGEIYHISLIGLKVSNPKAPDGLTTELPHVPVSRQTLEASLVSPASSTAEFPDFREGYTAWKFAFDQGEAAIFQQQVAEIVGFVEDALKRQRRPKGPVRQ